MIGRSPGPDRTRHVAAMDERERKDFHFEFTTLRFRCLGEHGSWQGRTGIVPTGPRGRGSLSSLRASGDPGEDLQAATEGAAPSPLRVPPPTRVTGAPRRGGT